MRIPLSRTTWHPVYNRIVLESQIRLGAIPFRPELMRLLRCDEAWLHATAHEYLACPSAWKMLGGLRSPHNRFDGPAKSLDLAEGFALWALIKQLKPRVVVELGVNWGISARLWKDALTTYVPDHELILCDLDDRRRFISDDEATFLQADAFEVLPELFRTRQIDLLYNDAHPYDLIRESVAEAIAHKVPILAFHDTGRGRRGPFHHSSSNLANVANIPDRDDWGKYGHWERHVMAELLDRRILDEDYVESGEWRIQIFDSLFGFGVALRAGALEQSAAAP